MIKWQSKKCGFSLIEAMIILALISVAVMVLIPLLSQKSSIPRWRLAKDTDNHEFITYGENSNDRISIGDGIDAYDNDQNAKLAVKTLAVLNSNENSKNTISWHDTYASASGSYTLGKSNNSEVI